MPRKKIKFKKPCKICEEMFTPFSQDRICELCKKKTSIYLHLSRVSESLSRIINKLAQIPDKKREIDLDTCKEIVDNAKNILSKEIKFKQRHR